MASGNSDLPDGWEVISDLMTREEINFWTQERRWVTRKRKRPVRIKVWDKPPKKVKRKYNKREKRKYDKMRYIQKKREDTRPKLVCIYGPSGSGKTYASTFLKKWFGVHVICSYTTRPKRRTEKNGVSHYFVSDNDMPPKDEMLAYTFFGGYHYWALKSDVQPPVTVYVVDEAGINELMRFRDIYRIVVVRIECKEKIRSSRGVSNERIERDSCRVSINERPYILIKNNGTFTEFKEDLKKMYNRIMEL